MHRRRPFLVAAHPVAHPVFPVGPVAVFQVGRVVGRPDFLVAPVGRVVGRPDFLVAPAGPADQVEALPVASPVQDFLPEVLRRLLLQRMSARCSH